MWQKVGSMFVRYRNFKFVSRDNLEGSRIMCVIKGTVEKVTKFPFCKEKVETVGVFLDSLSWKFAKDGKYTPTEVQQVIDVWKMENNKELSIVGQSR